MDILEGLLYINEKDVWLTYNVFLSEDKEGDFTNYSELQKPPSTKPQTAVSFRENDGEKLPAELTIVFEPRDVTLQFTMIADDRRDWLLYYTKFLSMLRSGWLTIRVPELERSYKMYYLSCSGYTQLTPIENNDIAGKFKIKFREPIPVI